MLSTLVAQFLESPTPTPHPLHQKAALNKFVKIIDRLELDFQNMSTKNWEKALNAYDASVEVRQKYRIVLISFYEWLSQNDELHVAESLVNLKQFKMQPGVNIEIDTSAFFGSIEELLDTCDKLFPLAEAFHYGAYQPMVCLGILAWYGFESGEMISLLKSDVVFNEDHCFIKGRVISNEKASRILAAYINNDFYERNDLRNYALKNSSFLFRSVKADRFDNRSVIYCTQHANDVAQNAQSPKRFSLNRIRMSGIFVSVFESVSSKQLPLLPSLKPRSELRSAVKEILQDALGYELNTASAFRRAYCEFYAWCKAFRSDYFTE